MEDEDFEKLHFRSDKAQCLRNKPDVGKPYPKILPGRLLSRDEQCRRTMGLTSHEVQREKSNTCDDILYETFFDRSPRLHRTLKKPRVWRF